MAPNAAAKKLLREARERAVSVDASGLAQVASTKRGSHCPLQARASSEMRAKRKRHAIGSSFSVSPTTNNRAAHPKAMSMDSLRVIAGQTAGHEKRCALADPPELATSPQRANARATLTRAARAPAGQPRAHGSPPARPGAS